PGLRSFFYDKTLLLINSDISEIRFIKVADIEPFYFGTCSIRTLCLPDKDCRLFFYEYFINFLIDCFALVIIQLSSSLFKQLINFFVVKESTVAACSLHR